MVHTCGRQDAVLVSVSEPAIHSGSAYPSEVITSSRTRENAAGFLGTSSTRRGYHVMLQPQGPAGGGSGNESGPRKRRMGPSIAFLAVRRSSTRRHALRGVPREAARPPA